MCVISHTAMSSTILPPYHYQLLTLSMLYRCFLIFRQYRLVAYRVVLEWALKGQPLGRGNRLALPSCVVWAVRDAFPSTTGQYGGSTPREIEDIFWPSWPNIFTVPTYQHCKLSIQPLGIRFSMTIIKIKKTNSNIFFALFENTICAHQPVHLNLISIWILGIW